MQLYQNSVEMTESNWLNRNLLQKSFCSHNRVFVWSPGNETFSYMLTKLSFFRAVSKIYINSTYKKRKDNELRQNVDTRVPTLSNLIIIFAIKFSLALVHLSSNELKVGWHVSLVSKSFLRYGYKDLSTGHSVGLTVS